MIIHTHKRGFTLIELLVVVLIIGVLASIALPQYRRATQKARLAQLDTILNTANKSISSYLLSNGAPGEVVFLAGEDNVGDIDIGTNCSGDECYSKAGAFSVACTTGGICGVQLDTSRTSPSTSDDNWLGNAQMLFLRNERGEWYVESLEVNE